MQLLTHHQGLGLARPAAPRTRPAPRSLTVRAEGGEGRPIREYKEDTGEVVVSGEQKKADTALYADQVAQAAKKQDNLSREMKQRLRQEYYGLGGAENQVGRPARGMFVVAAAAAAEPVAADAPAASPSSSLAAGGAPAQQQLEQQQLEQQQLEQQQDPEGQQRPGGGGSKWVIDANEVLTSTWEHKAWTYGCMGLLAGCLAEAASGVHSWHDAGVVGAAVLGAYVLSDLGTAVFHWGVDNYGDGSTPVLGRQIAAFQGHHQRPWTITQREFANNVHQVFKPATYPSLVLLVLGPFLPLPLAAFLPSFTFFVCMSQQFHAWSHMKKSELPALVVALQDAHLLIGRKAHGAHHKPNFEGNYSIVSGWWNPLLDGTGFFRGLERLVAASTGVEPRCWYPPEHGWAEQEQQQQQQQPAAAAAAQGQGAL